MIIAYADVFDSISALITTMGGKFASIANPIAVVALIICGIKMLMASDPQSVRSAKQWIIIILLGLIVINLAGPIVNTIQTLSNETINVTP